MSTADARTVGVVVEFLIDPGAARIIALRLTKTSGPGDTLHWDDLTAFGSHAVTVPSAAVIKPARGRAAELASGDSDLPGKRLLTDTGVDLGTIDDIEFDPATGAIGYLRSGPDRIAGSRLIGCGTYAAIIHAV